MSRLMGHSLPLALLFFRTTSVFADASADADEAAQLKTASDDLKIATADLKTATRDLAAAQEKAKTESANTNQKVEEAKKDAGNAIASAEQTKNALVDLKTGTLVEKAGLTGGFSIAMQLPIATKTVSVKYGPPSAMPYVAAFPYYWFKQAEYKRFCANRFLSGSKGSAQRAADALARENAKPKLDDLVTWLTVAFRRGDYTSGESISDAVAVEGLRYAGLGGYAEALKVTAKNIAKDIAADQLNESAKLIYQGEIANQFWQANMETNCGWSMTGVYVGVPLKYRAISSFDEPGDETMDSSGVAVSDDARVKGERYILPRVSFGLAFAPTNWLHLLAGATYSQIKTGELDVGKNNDYMSAWSMTLGAGGALDVVDLFK